MTMNKEFAGTDLSEIRASLRDEGFTEVVREDRIGDTQTGFELWRPFDDLPSHDCVHVVVWPMAPDDLRDRGIDKGYWSEEF
jgi:hypothetical protein